LSLSGKLNGAECTIETFESVINKILTYIG
jgi:hypothetical protein